MMRTRRFCRRRARAKNVLSREQHSEVSQKESPFDSVLSLHHTLGNQAVQRLVESGTLQTKLTVGAPNDLYEQEADRVASQVMHMSNAELQEKPFISRMSQRGSAQRMCPECEEEAQRKPIEENKEDLQLQSVEEENKEALQLQSLEENKENLQMQSLEDEEDLQMQTLDDEEEEVVQTKKGSIRTPEVTSAIESQIQAQRSGGQGLSESTRNFFEPRFGADFSGVRVHTDSRADTLNRSVNARAFTTGQDIFFRKGEYNPSDSKGGKLLAHELTHVVQQNSMVSRAVLQRLSDPDCDNVSGLPLSDNCSGYRNTCNSRSFTDKKGTAVAVRVTVNYHDPEDCSFPPGREDFRVRLIQCGWIDTEVKDFGTSDIGDTLTGRATLPGAGTIIGNNKSQLQKYVTF